MVSLKKKHLEMSGKRETKKYQIFFYRTLLFFSLVRNKVTQTLYLKYLYFHLAVYETWTLIGICSVFALFVRLLENFSEYHFVHLTK